MDDAPFARGRLKRIVRRWLAILALPVGIAVIVYQGRPLLDGLALLRHGVPAQARVIDVAVEEREGAWLIGDRHRARISVLGATVEQTIGVERFAELSPGGTVEVTVLPGRPGAVDIAPGQTLLSAVKGVLVGVILAAVAVGSALVTWRRNRRRG
ncbi:MAG: hypothetical protein AAF371_00120 [Pseudomonadota bacterium]